MPDAVRDLILDSGCYGRASEGRETPGATTENDDQARNGRVNE
jgi:hypothetical protein